MQYVYQYLVWESSLRSFIEAAWFCSRVGLVFSKSDAKLGNKLWLFGCSLSPGGVSVGGRARGLGVDRKGIIGEEVPDASFGGTPPRPVTSQGLSQTNFIKTCF